MNFLIFIFILFSYSFNSDTIVKQVNNNPSAGWKATKYNFLTNKQPFSSIPSTLSKSLNKKVSNFQYKLHTKYETLPSKFDSNIQWPECKQKIRDQGNCGACWAFGSVEAIQFRECISTKINIPLSPQWLVSCDTTDNGCTGGGTQSHAYLYYQYFGISTEDCFPYSSGKMTVPPCPTSCNDGTPPKLHYGSRPYSLPQDLLAIQTEIVNNGPVTVSMDVYEDFMQYKTGIYHHVTGANQGGHCVMITGYGYDEKTRQWFWKVQNSWTDLWGENGYFRILAGVNECGIEGDVVGGFPRLPPTPLPVPKRPVSPNQRFSTGKKLIQVPLPMFTVNVTTNFAEFYNADLQAYRLDDCSTPTECSIIIEKVKENFTYKLTRDFPYEKTKCIKTSGTQGYYKPPDEIIPKDAKFMRYTIEGGIIVQEWIVKNSVGSSTYFIPAVEQPHGSQIYRTIDREKTPHLTITTSQTILYNIFNLNNDVFDVDNYDCVME